MIDRMDYKMYNTTKNNSRERLRRRKGRGRENLLLSSSWVRCNSVVMLLPLLLFIITLYCCCSVSTVVARHDDTTSSRRNLRSTAVRWNSATNTQQLRNGHKSIQQELPVSRHHHSNNGSYPQQQHKHQEQNQQRRRRRRLVKEEEVKADDKAKTSKETPSKNGADVKASRAADPVFQAEAIQSDENAYQPPAASPIVDKGTKKGEADSPTKKNSSTVGGTSPAVSKGAASKTNENISSKNSDTPKKTPKKNDNGSATIPLAKFSIELGMIKPKEKVQTTPSSPTSSSSSGTDSNSNTDSTSEDGTSTIDISVEEVETALTEYLTEAMDLENGTVLELTGTETSLSDAIERPNTIVHRYEFSGTITTPPPPADDTDTTSLSIQQSILWRRQKAALLDLQSNLEETINSVIQSSWKQNHTNDTNTNDENSNGSKNSTTTNSSNTTNTNTSSVVTDDSGSPLSTVHVVGVDVENLLDTRDDSGRGGRGDKGGKSDGDGTASSSIETSAQQAQSSNRTMYYIIALCVAVCGVGAILFYFVSRYKMRSESAEIGDDGATNNNDLDTEDGGTVYIGRRRQGGPATAVAAPPTGKDFWSSISHNRRVGGRANIHYKPKLQDIHGSSNSIDLGGVVDPTPEVSNSSSNHQRTKGNNTKDQQTSHHDKISNKKNTTKNPSATTKFPKDVTKPNNSTRIRYPVGEGSGILQ